MNHVMKEVNRKTFRFHYLNIDEQYRRKLSFKRQFAKKQLIIIIISNLENNQHAFIFNSIPISLTNNEMTSINKHATQSLYNVQYVINNDSNQFFVSVDMP